MTTAISLIQRLQQHSGWSSNNLLTTAAGLNEDQLQRQFPIGQGSVWKSLTHMYAAEFVWLAALQGTDSAVAPGDVRGQLPGNQLGEGAMHSIEELRPKWTELQQRWAQYLAALKPEALDETVYRCSSTSPNEPFGARRSDVLLHVFAHAQYTSAQVVNMLRQLGVEKLPPTMVMAMARQEAKHS
jgi:uncharacterized damage-inducible protein DinB